MLTSLHSPMMTLKVYCYVHMQSYFVNVCMYILYLDTYFLGKWQKSPTLLVKFQFRPKIFPYAFNLQNLLMYLMSCECQLKIFPMQVNPFCVYVCLLPLSLTLPTDLQGNRLTPYPFFIICFLIIIVHPPKCHCYNHKLQVPIELISTLDCIHIRDMMKSEISYLLLLFPIVVYPNAEIKVVECKRCQLSFPTDGTHQNWRECKWNG